MGKRLRTIVRHLSIEEAAMKCVMNPKGVARMNQYSTMKRRFGKKATSQALSEANNTMKMVGLDPFLINSKR